MRDYVDEEDYPASQEYFLYADSQVKTTFEHLTICFSKKYVLLSMLECLPVPLPQQMARLPAADSSRRDPQVTKYP
jgi:hypothetical protein